MRFRIGCRTLKFLSLLISLFLVISLLLHISGSKLDTLQTPAKIHHQDGYLKCEVIHIGIVSIGYRSNFYLYTMLKSLYFYRTKPLHFHVIVDDISETHLKNMFDRWDVPQVTFSFYNVHNFVSSYSSLTSKNAKLMFPEIIDTSTTNKIIVLNTYLTFIEDVYELWALFNNFKGKQAIGLVENQSNEYYQSKSSEITNVGKGFSTDAMLFNLEVLKPTKWKGLLTRAVSDIIPLFKDTELTDRNIINAVASENFELLYIISCDRLTQIFTESYNCDNKNHVKIVNWNTSNNFLRTANLEYNGASARTQLSHCVDFNKNIIKDTVKRTSNDKCKDFRESYTYHWRTLLFFREFKHNVSGDDVTLVSHLTYDRLPALEHLTERWEGPMSLALFVTDSELYKFMNFVEHSKLLQKRYNIAYHAVFKERFHHPLNLCRNVAIRNVVTPYVFLSDIDLVPMQGMYGSLKKYVSSAKSMEKKILVVPAFETNPNFTENIPKTKKEALKGINSNYLFQFKRYSFVQGHGPTDYTKWITAEMPYKVEWEFKYEPYVVVQSNITGYDERFVGHGLDKISYFTKLKAQGYDFVVLPNVFIVHKRHNPSPEKLQVLKSRRYKNCLYKQMAILVKELNKEYGLKLPLTEIK